MKATIENGELVIRLPLSRVGAERLAWDLGVSRQFLLQYAGLSTPPTEPGVQLLLHPALHSSLRLGFSSVTGDA
jgi:hypothetical protein